MWQTLCWTGQMHSCLALKRCGAASQCVLVFCPTADACCHQYFRFRNVN